MTRRPRDDERTVENQGSLARDHLANERTFLAWVRTGLGVIGLGVLIAKLAESEGLAAEILGLLMIVFGALALIYALVRYEQITGLLNEGRYRTARKGPLWVTAISILLAAGAAILVLLH